jgi:hypothetical protein
MWEWLRNLLGIEPGTLTYLEYTKDSDGVTITGYHRCIDRAEEMVIPREIRGTPTTRIGENSFSGCRDLKSVVIPDSVTRIGKEAFYDCKGLASVIIPDAVTSIGYRAFGNCRALTSVTIPDSVESIGHGAFSSCEGLTSVVMPDSVTSIGENAFEWCVLRGP